MALCWGFGLILETLGETCFRGIKLLLALSFTLMSYSTYSAQIMYLFKTIFVTFSVIYK